ncbi:OmpA/MotB family protein [Capillibacterium thermochitinicola]|uniref:Flagellar motor protein MotB n=1 Tax=Capillibacterium thermochitinicola TaxID=2699427 RepID=A0A8J6HYS0_9FIRM|nr:flagellar motor protein MotB [Capillibacterium thermochitinicola]MBA2134052.1 flagellar motor protein MotB [Capillibacterium thermochitinicola]
MYKKKPKEQPRGAPPWMTTYSDLVTNLLTFFVLLFAFSNVNADKYEQIAASLRSVFSGSPSIVYGGKYPLGEQMPFEISSPVNAEFQVIYEEIEAMLAEEGVGAAVEIFQEERGLIISFKEKIFFDIGSAQLRPEARSLLSRVGRILAADDHDIRVEGHTCDLPIRSRIFPSNWELSTSRATNVTRFLIEEVGIEPSRLGATGFAEFRPIAPNDSEENRIRNRRVDLLLLSRNNL